MKKFITILAAGLSMGMAHSASAADLDVTITNLTNGITFTPFLAAAHTEANLFNVGEAASPELQTMAEGGSIAGLVTIVEGLNATVAANPAGGLLAPAASTSFNLNTDGTENNFLSVVAMLLPTNDAFAGLNAVEIPTEPGTYNFYLPAYDAGTEANNELLVGMAAGASGVLGMPAAPGGNAGTGGTGASGVDANETVHIHRGALGDTDATGGVSDLDSTIHRWLNPVVRVTVTVN